MASDPFSIWSDHVLQPPTIGAVLESKDQNGKVYPLVSRTDKESDAVLRVVDG